MYIENRMLKLNMVYKYAAVLYVNSQNMDDINISSIGAFLIAAIILLQNHCMEFCFLVSRSLILQAENGRDRDEVC